MQFLSVALGIASSVALPAFLVLYFLKRQYEVLPVPSTRLWREALSQLHADRPWQKLRSSLLFFLQLAAILLLIFSAFRPVTRSGVPAEMVIVVDASGSMQARDLSPDRFGAAKAEALKLLDALPEGGRLTLIAVGRTPVILLSRAADRLQARRVIEGMRCENGGAAMDEALQLAAALRRETGAGIAVISDRYQGKAAIPTLGEGTNRAVEAVAASKVKGQLQALSVIRSYGFAGAVTVECRADGRLVDAREIEFLADSAQTVYWNNLPNDAKALNVRLKGVDALSLDDSADCVIASGRAIKALLVTKQNVFLEAALKLREDIELFKQSPDTLDSPKGYDLYVFDGLLPKALPNDGSIIVFNPAIAVDGLEQSQGGGGTLAAAQSAQAASMLQHIDIGKARLAKSMALTLSGGWQPLVFLGDKAVVAVREQNGGRQVVLGFDLHDSNLPMLKEFPILMQNMLSWALSDATGGVSGVIIGDPVPLLPHALATKINVVTPSGAVEQAAPPFPVAPFEQTDVPGIYEVRQYGSDGKEIANARASFAVKASHGESDLCAVEQLPVMDNAKGGSATQAGSTNWWLYVALAAMALVLIEWLVMRYGRRV